MLVNYTYANELDDILRLLDGRLGPTALRAFAIACCRRVWGRLDERGRSAVNVAARFAEGNASREELEMVRAELGKLGEDAASEAAWYCVWNDPYIAAREASWYAAAAAVGRFADRERWAAERAAQAGFLRKIAAQEPPLAA